MKPSYYNITSEINSDELILSNLLSGAIITIDKNSYNLISENRQDKISSELLNKLIIGRFIIPDDFNELNYIQTRLSYHKYRTDLLSLTILPTLDCNFDCTYCYENNTKSYMSRETINQLINFTAINLTGKKRFSVAWYGGEPLLASSTIWKLSEIFIAMSEKLSIDYDASMITNGSLLTKETVDKLIKYKIPTIQVTIDGPKDIHNKMRPFSSKCCNNPNSYDTILDNINYACNKLNVNIRINIGKNNYNKLDTLLNSLKFNKLKDKVTIYVTPIIPFGTSSKVNNNTFSSKCFDYPSFANIEPDLFNTIEKSGFNTGYDFDGSDCSCCRAICLNNWVIDPEGNLLKCWDSIGEPSGIVGHISKPPKEIPMYQNSNLLKWISFNPLNDNKCRECKFIPICMGGCAHRVIKDNVDNNYKCSMTKFNYKQMLKKLYLEAQ
ncbi:MAG: SPASM domain-containing protein [Vallitalea sp.]|jgi:uncharacterized protein|nr:SPASM domain-containing protein [Vallitalea sp.]